jgi:hypothetical protein
VEQQQANNNNSRHSTDEKDSDISDQLHDYPPFQSHVKGNLFPQGHGGNQENPNFEGGKFLDVVASAIKKRLGKKAEISFL